MEIRILGELEVLRDGRPVALPASKRTRALLGFLVATGQPHLREKLCELFWDGPDDPRAALRWSLAKLRPLVDGLTADRERVSCVVPADLQSVKNLDLGGATVEGLRAAAQKFRGELLDGLDLPDCFRYQAWCAAERESARSLRLALLDALVERDSPEEALGWARARLSVDPLAERAHAQLMGCLHRLGRTREALKHYDEARQLLTSELGARGLSELERARQECLQSPGAVEPAAPKAAPIAAPPTRSTLVGRTAERAALQRWVAATSAGDPHPVGLLVGEPGIGKSRLLDELSAAMRAAGGRVLHGRAFEAESLRPYGAWLDAFSALEPAQVPFNQPSADRNRLFDDVTALVTSLAPPGRPLLLWFDDVQWLDESSAGLLHFAARAVERSRVLLACAARPGELADNRAMLQTVRALARDGRLARLDLGPLNEAEIAELVGDVDVDKVMSASGGNPLYAQEVALALRGGRPAASLDDLLRERLDKVEGRARDLLPFAAALGHAFEPALVAAASGLPAADLLAAAEELERRGILRVAAGGWDFSHDLVRDAAYRSLSEPRRRLVHLQIAQALGRKSDPDGAHASERAQHAALGGDLEAAARSWLAAGERCLRVFAQAEAYKAASRGLELLDKLSPTVRVELELPLYHVLIFARGGRGGWREIESQVARAVLSAESAGRSDLVQDGFHMLGLLAWRGEEFDRAFETTVQSAERARTADPTTAARALATSSRCMLLIERDVPRALEMAAEALQIASHHQLQLLEVSWAAGMADHYVGLLDRSLDWFETALRQPGAGTDHWGEVMCMLDATTIALERRRFDEAIRWAERTGQVAVKLGEGAEGPFAAALEALARFGAEQKIDVEPSLARLSDLDAQTHLSYACNTLAELELERGRPKLAAAAAERALVAARKVDRKSEIALALAILIQIRGGDLTELQSLVDEGAALSARARRRVSMVFQGRS